MGQGYLGASIIRIGFWGLYCNDHKEPPKKLEEATGCYRSTGLRSFRVPERATWGRELGHVYMTSGLPVDTGSPQTRKP